MAKAKNASRKKKLDAVEEQLRQEREDLLEQIAELERRSDDGSEQDTPEGGDPADVGSETLGREQDLALARDLKDVVTQVEEALARIESGTYGTCESCGKDIPAARLKALPYATLCVDCKRADARRY